MTPLRRLGRDRVGVLAGDKDKSQIKQFLNSYVKYTAGITWMLTNVLSRRVHQVLVIGYEKLRSVM